MFWSLTDVLNISNTNEFEKSHIAVVNYLWIITHLFPSRKITWLSDSNKLKSLKQVGLEVQDITNGDFFHVRQNRRQEQLHLYRKE